MNDTAATGGRGKVLHVLDHSFPIHDGYAFRSAEIVRNVRGEGWSTVQVTSAKQGRSAREREVADGIEFHRTEPSTRVLDRLPLLDQWSVVSTLRRRLEDIVACEAPDILHAHSPVLNALAALPVARRFGIPLVYEVRAFWEDAAVDQGTCREGDLRYRATRALETYALRRVDYVVCICQGLRDDVVARGISPQRVTVVPNAVDPARFTGARTRDVALAAELGLVEGRTLGFAGSFFAFEGLDLALRAMPLIVRTHADARLVLIGDGEQAQALRALAAELGIDRYVIFVGRVPHAQMARYYSVLDVLLYPRISKRITELVTPLKPLEAMVQGKPVLASDVGGHRELIEPGVTGVLHRPGSVDSIAAEAIRLLDDPAAAAALGRRARVRVLAERTWKANAARYTALYASLMPSVRGLPR